MNIESVKSSSEQFRVSLQAIKKGSLYKILVQPKSTQAPANGLIRIETNFSAEAPCTLILSAELN